MIRCLIMTWFGPIVRESRVGDGSRGGGGRLRRRRGHQQHADSDHRRSEADDEGRGGEEEEAEKRLHVFVVVFVGWRETMKGGGNVLSKFCGLSSDTVFCLISALGAIEIRNES